MSKYGKLGKYYILYSVFCSAFEIEQVIESPDGILVDTLVSRLSAEEDFMCIENIKDFNSITYCGELDLSDRKLYNKSNYNLIDFVLSVLELEVGRVLNLHKAYVEKTIKKICNEYKQCLDKDTYSIMIDYLDSDYSLLLASCYPEAIYNTILPDYVTLINQTVNPNDLDIWPFNNDIASLILTQLSWLNINKSLIYKLKLLNTRKIHNLDIQILIVFYIIKEVMEYHKTKKNKDSK